MSKLEINPYALSAKFISRNLARKNFKDVSPCCPTGQVGFSAPYLTVMFKVRNTIMEVTHFSESGKHFTTNFLCPISEDDFLRKIDMAKPEHLPYNYKPSVSRPMAAM